MSEFSHSEIHQLAIIKCIEFKSVKLPDQFVVDIRTS